MIELRTEHRAACILSATAMFIGAGWLIGFCALLIFILIVGTAISFACVKTDNKTSSQWQDEDEHNQVTYELWITSHGEGW